MQCYPDAILPRNDRPSLAPVPLGLEAEDVGGGDLAVGDGAVPRADDERADVPGGGRGVREAGEGGVNLLEARLVGEAEDKQCTHCALLTDLKFTFMLESEFE